MSLKDGYARIREYRRQNQISQQKMAAILGISRRTYGSYENGVKFMPVEILIQIADYFDESFDVLADHVPVQTKGNPRKLQF